MKANELMIGDWVRVRLPWRSPVDGHIENRWYMRRVMGIRTNGKSNKFYLYFEPWGVLPHDIEPLPLTSKILEKNGFSFTGSGQYEMMLATPFGISGDRYNIYVGLKKKTIDVFVAFANTESKAGWRKHNSTLLEVSGPYVHELQHALRLCGINKQIEL